MKNYSWHTVHINKTLEIVLSIFLGICVETRLGLSNWNGIHRLASSILYCGKLGLLPIGNCYSDFPLLQLSYSMYL